MKYCFLFLFFIGKLLAVVPANEICLLSIAKSGSTMSIHVVKELTGYKARFMNSYYDVVLPDIEKNHFVTGHFFNEEVIEKYLENSKKKFIVTVRDLRDVLVSASRYYDEAPFHMHYWKGRMSRYVFEKWKRKWLKYKNKGLLGKNVDIQLNTKKYISDTVLDIKNAVCWLKKYEHVFNDRVLLLHYEDLVGDKGGGTKKRQVQTIKRIADFLELELPEEEYERIAKSIWGRTSTFAIGKARQYHKYLSKDTLKNFWSLFSEEMDYLGYTK